VAELHYEQKPDARRPEWSAIKVVVGILLALLVLFMLSLAATFYVL
jgi:hypothetical protein